MGLAAGAFEIPAGLVAATPSFAMVAQRYMARYGLREETLAKIAVDARYNAQFNPDAIFYGKPITIDDVMRSRRVCDPLKLLEIVMPCFGGGALLVTTPRARGARTTPAGVRRGLRRAPHAQEHQLRAGPARQSDPRRRRTRLPMAGVAHAAIDVVQPYDCFTITVLVTLENAGFCGKGEGERFVSEHYLRWDGDFPLNTHGGQLGAGQAGTRGRPLARSQKRCASSRAAPSGRQLAEVRPRLRQRHRRHDGRAGRADPAGRDVMQSEARSEPHAAGFALA